MNRVNSAVPKLIPTDLGGGNRFFCVQNSHQLLVVRSSPCYQGWVERYGDASSKEKRSLERQLLSDKALWRNLIKNDAAFHAIYRVVPSFVQDQMILTICRRGIECLSWQPSWLEFYSVYFLSRSHMKLLLLTYVAQLMLRQHFESRIFEHFKLVTTQDDQPHAQWLKAVSHWGSLNLGAQEQIALYEQKRRSVVSALFKQAKRMTKDQIEAEDRIDQDEDQDARGYIVRQAVHVSQLPDLVLARVIAFAVNISGTIKDEDFNSAAKSLQP